MTSEAYDNEEFDDSEQDGPNGNLDAAGQLQGLVRYVVDNLVEHPEQADVQVEQRGNMVVLGVRLPEEELGKVIGRGGRIAKSIRTALMVAGSQHHLRVSLDIDAADTDDDSYEDDSVDEVSEDESVEATVDAESPADE